MKNEPEALSENHFPENHSEAIERETAEQVDEVPRKKPFVKPTLDREETLPKVTTGFIGSFPT